MQTQRAGPLLGSFCSLRLLTGTVLGMLGGLTSDMLPILWALSSDRAPTTPPPADGIFPRSGPVQPPSDWRLFAHGHLGSQLCNPW